MQSNEELQRQVDELKETLELLTAPKEIPAWRAKLGDTFSRLFTNMIDDLPTTGTGLVVAGTIVYSQWPHVEPQAIAEALGFGLLGGISTSKGNQGSNKQEFG